MRLAPAVIGLTLHFAAYMAESIRAAIIGIDRSQMEAGTLSWYDNIAKPCVE